MVSHQLLRACAVLGVQLVHSRPWRPQGRGKIERAFRTVNDQFVVELAHSEIDSLEKLNSLFSAWVESVYHRQVHSETGAAPLERFLSAGAPAPVDPALLRDAFLWSEKRKVNKVAGCSLFGNEYEVDPAWSASK
jgi:putative transposase